MAENPQVVWHQPSVTRAEREQLSGHHGCVVWFTGLSGSGKSTIANLVDRALYQQRVHSYLLDGDNVRHGLNATPQMLAPRGEHFAQRFGLGFAAEDREENIRRVGCLADLLASAGLVVLTAFVSPYRRDREQVRAWIEKSGGAGSFLEVFVDTPLEICEQRDPKGLYKKARSGEIPFFTGISDPYEPPVAPDLCLKTASAAPDALCREVLQFLTNAGKIG